MWWGQEGLGVITAPGGRGTPSAAGIPSTLWAGTLGWHFYQGRTDTCSPKAESPPSGSAFGFQNRLSGSPAGPALRKLCARTPGGTSCHPTTPHWLWVFLLTRVGAQRLGHGEKRVHPSRSFECGARASDCATRRLEPRRVLAWRHSRAWGGRNWVWKSCCPDQNFPLQNPVS